MRDNDTGLERVLRDTRVMSKRKPHAGFTVVEMLLVVAVGGIISAMAVPAIGGATRRYKVNNASGTITAQIRAARYTAVATNRTMRVRFNCPGPGQFRVVEVVGTAAIDNDSDRCSETDYPYPDPNPAAAPNADGPVIWMNDGTDFTNVQDVQISNRGRIQPLNNCPACVVAAPPASIGVTNGYETHTITVSTSGMATITSSEYTSPY